MLDHDLPGQGQKWSAPLFKLPFTDNLLQVRNFQCHNECGPYETMYVDCLEAYGYHVGKQKCRLILEDLFECLFKVKRMRRIHDMDKERERQIESGERKPAYTEKPLVDIF